MKMSTLSLESLRHALNMRDLTNPEEGLHAMQLIIQGILTALENNWKCQIKTYRASPIVSIEDNYDSLKYPSDGAAREARYTRYVCQTALLRTQTSAMIPKALQSIADDVPDDILLCCPGIVYRRDAIDCLHTGEPHQVDLWRISSMRQLTQDDLLTMIKIIVETTLPGCQWRTESRLHPYTLHGLQIDVYHDGQWIEIGECGIAHPDIIKQNIHNAGGITGLACGLGLDRMLMLRKGIRDIRLLRSTDVRIVDQMNDLLPYKEVSCMPSVVRDLSIVLAADNEAEDLGDRVRTALQEHANNVESITILSQTNYDDLPQAAIERLGISKGQKNVLVRIVLRALDRTLTRAECNYYRDLVYKALHEGTVWDLTCAK